MSSLNKKSLQFTERTFEGSAVKSISKETQLTRMVLANMLFEDQFYVDGQVSSQLIKDLVKHVNPDFTSKLAIKARTDMKLRHVPLLLVRELARNKTLNADTVNEIIQRPDEMGELLSIYWKDGKTPLSHQLKKGLAKAFLKFNEYSLAKWDKNSASISIRDTMFLVHPHPTSPEQEALFKKVANKELSTPDTWEAQLSAGADKKETFTRLMDEGKLGALAFLRNLRNMVQSGVDERVIREYATTLDVSKVLPFRFLAAARVVPQFEDMLEQMLFRCTENMPKLKGKTRVIVDVSGSMFGPKVSAKSDLDRFDAAAALAIVMREICEQVEIWSFSTQEARVAPRRGFALVEAISKSQQHGGTYLGRSLGAIERTGKADRDVVITDEQSADRPAKPQAKGYILNVGSYQNGVNHDAWTTITGFSEAVVSYIIEVEKESV